MKIPEMKVNIVSRNTIKPASPTPPHLRTLSLSLFDQHMSSIYVNFLLFYPSPININGGGDAISNALERSRLLQKSLSQTLDHFYPMAGQHNDAAFIDCNDEGAYFLEARIGCQLVEFLSNPDSELMKCFFPTNDAKTMELALDANAMLLVQISIFECGGMAMALCVSHKIADATSDYNLIQSWAAISRGTGEVVLPEFIGSSLLPPKELPHEPTPTAAAEKCITRRFVFEGTKIASLKAKIGDEMLGQRRPSNVETVSAFIMKCAIAAQSKSKSLMPSMLLQMVNLRKRMVPPMPENTVGNPVWACEVILKEKDMELPEIVVNMRKELTEFVNKKANKFNGDEGYEMINKSLRGRELLMERGVNTYWCTSFCRMPFYEIDFGWGKPVWAAAGLPVKNLILLMDTKYEGGIEAWVTLDEHEMAIFERNEELHEFASLNSSPRDNLLYDEKSRLFVMQ